MGNEEKKTRKKKRRIGNEEKKTRKKKGKIKSQDKKKSMRTRVTQNHPTTQNQWNPKAVLAGYDAKGVSYYRAKPISIWSFCAEISTRP